MKDEVKENLKRLLVDAVTLIEASAHLPPRRAIGTMLYAAGMIAVIDSMSAEDFVKGAMTAYAAGAETVEAHKKVVKNDSD